MRGWLLTAVELHHFPIVRNIVLDRCHGTRIADNHNRHTCQQKALYQKLNAPLAAGFDFINIFQQLVYRIRNYISADGTIGLAVNQTADLPICLRNVLAKHVAHAGLHHGKRRGAHNADITYDDFWTHAGAVNFYSPQKQRRYH